MSIAMLKRLIIKTLPNVPIDQRDRLPKKPGVYYACANFRVLYVGMSNNIHERWNSRRFGEHHELKNIVEMGGTRLHYRVLPLHWVKYWEAVEIDALRPPLNDQFPNPVYYRTNRIALEDLLVKLFYVGCAGLLGWSIVDVFVL